MSTAILPEIFIFASSVYLDFSDYAFFKRKVKIADTYYPPLHNYIIDLYNLQCCTKWTS